MALLSNYFNALVRNGRWFQFSMTSALLAWLIVMAILWPFTWLIGTPALPLDESPVRVLFDGLLFAPLLENALVVIGLLLLRNRFSDRQAVGLMTVVAVALHAAFASWSAIAALLLFSMMGTSYIAWQPLGPRRAFFIICLQHLLFNLPATAATALEVARLR
ncbi:hypothetical protein FHT39_000237 [Mitsuaria sp. BK045]|uniref:hypothetical protein n=1 Tax=unclassified Roseateles TaxID=2626991 RepID=UPI00161DA51C|nr:MULTISPECIES: hypothetical protein [unclassified Roseateles]MBB3291598.1 hypothetical protein [Mitsuaria sp. BK041]MBB3360815.1 hypothetical protein [Mitsuaria sp. BK045]